MAAKPNSCACPTRWPISRLYREVNPVDMMSGHMRTCSSVSDYPLPFLKACDSGSEFLDDADSESGYYALSPAVVSVGSVDFKC